MTRGVDVDDLMFIDDFDDIIETVERAETKERPAVTPKKTGKVNHTAAASSTVRTEKASSGQAASSRPAKAQEVQHHGTVQKKKKRSRSGGPFGLVRYLSKKEKAILGVSLAAIILFVSVGTVALRVYGRSAAMRSFSDVGKYLSTDSVIGKEGIVAVGSAAASATLVAEEPEETEPEETLTEIEIVAQTIKGDLKIKFVSAETGRIVTGVEFGARVTDPQDKEETHYDTDKDGIIYLDGLAAGDYKVAYAPPKGDDSRLYREAKGQTARTVAVKDTVTMEVVDVADEVVDEAAAGPAGEAGDITPVESVPQDTVAWVESTRTPIGGTGVSYKEIQRSDINDPYVASGLRMSDYVYLEGEQQQPQEPQQPEPPVATVTYQVTVSAPTTATVGVPITFSVTVTASDDTADKNYGVSCVEVTNSGLSGRIEGNQITFNTAGSYTLKAWAAKDGNAFDAVTINVSDPAPAPQVRLTTTSAELTVGQTLTLALDNASASASFISSNSAVATVDGAGFVKAIGIGEAEIIATGRDGSTGESRCKITVRAGVNDNETLRDKQNNIVYKQNANGEYVAACNADFKNTETKLYIQVAGGNQQYRYTGWQTINGSTFYFDANGNYVTGQQVIRGVRYNFTNTGVLSMSTSNVGIDISAHQGVIDWNAVKSAGISFAIIRCGFRGYETGRLAEDSTYRRNIQGAINAGIKVGIYVYSSAVNEAEGVEEASFAVSLASGYGLALPIFIDVENPAGGRARGLDAGTRTAVIKAFCGTVQSAGYRAGVYSNTTWYNSMINTPELTGYTIWLAQYNDRPTYTRTKFDLWQYTSKGRIPGINGNVDMNYAYVNF